MDMTNEQHKRLTRARNRLITLHDDMAKAGVRYPVDGRGMQERLQPILADVELALYGQTLLDAEPL